MATLQNLEAKMASIENSLAAPRRRKGTSLGNVSICRSSPKLDTSSQSKEVRTAIQDREAIMQNLRMQLGLGKLPRPSGPPFDDSERPAAEQRFGRLKNDAENKRNAIRNLKSALDKLDVTENIDTRIRQAELEYALGREELQLLSIVEEARAIQFRLENSKPDAQALFTLIQNGQSLSLHAVQVNAGRWNVNFRGETGGFVVDWVCEGEDLYRGDRVLEVNGKIVMANSKDELQKMCGTSAKCDMVVVRKKSVVNGINQQQLQQSQADNARLQHRISYLEEQVKELLMLKEMNNKNNSSPSSGRAGTHITSISISSSPNTQSDIEEEKPQVYQRGSFVTTIVGGKPLDPLPNGGSSPSHSPPNQLKINSTSKTTITTNGKESPDHRKLEVKKDSPPAKSMKSLSTSLSKISISTDLYAQKREREKREREMRRERDRYYNNKNAIRNYSVQAQTINHGQQPKANHARSVEHLNHHQNLDKNSITASMNHIENSYSRKKSTTTDNRSIKSLDFDSDGSHLHNGDDKHDDYASEPAAAPRLRPTPPKKPLRLSLHRAQSLQAVMDASGLLDSMNMLERKRAIKRIHKNENGTEISSKYIEHSKGLPITSSLSRHKYI